MSHGIHRRYGCQCLRFLPGLNQQEADQLEVFGAGNLTRHGAGFAGRERAKTRNVPDIGKQSRLWRAVRIGASCPDPNGHGQSAYPNRLDWRAGFACERRCSGQSAYPNRLDFGLILDGILYRSGQSAYPNRLDSAHYQPPAALGSGQSAYPNRLDWVGRCGA